MRGWLGTETNLPMSWQSEATTISGSAPDSSARVAVWSEWVSWSTAKPSVIAGQSLQHGQDLIGHPALVLEGLGADDGPLLGRRLVHAAEGARWESACGSGGLGRHGPILAPEAPGVVPAGHGRQGGGVEAAGAGRDRGAAAGDGRRGARRGQVRGLRMRRAARSPPAAAATPEMTTAVRKPAEKLARMEVAGPGDARDDGEDGHGHQAAGPGHVVVDGRGHPGVVGRGRGPGRWW